MQREGWLMTDAENPHQEALLKMTAPLKRCPFCESDRLFVDSDDPIECRDCGATGPDNGPRGWGNRPIEDKLLQRIDRLEWDWCPGDRR